MAHEIGHIVSDVMGLGDRLSALPAGDRLQLGQELTRLFERKRGGNPEEWIADFFALYLLYPEAAKRQAPIAAAIIRKWWNENPAVNRTLIFFTVTQSERGLA